MITIEDLKERWFNAYPEIMGISGDKPTQCYAKKDVDEYLAGIEAVPRTDNSAVIDRLLDERRWRKFSEEMPEHDTWCLVFHEGEIDVDHYTNDCNSYDRFVMYGFYVTHWMPLPSAPKEGE